MLPKIQEIAQQHGLQAKERYNSRKDTRYKCPFCNADAGKKGKYYLSLNIEDDVFRCWHCTESGGTLKFMALLSNKSQAEIMEELRGPIENKKKRVLHPAEKLTPIQMRVLGLKGPSWYALKKRDYDLYKRSLNWVWDLWQIHVESEKRVAYIRFYIADTAERRKSICREYAHSLSLSASDLLFEFVTYKATTNADKPDWVLSAERFVGLSGLKSEIKAS